MQKVIRSFSELDEFLMGGAEVAAIYGESITVVKLSARQADDERARHADAVRASAQRRTESEDGEIRDEARKAYVEARRGALRNEALLAASLLPAVDLGCSKAANNWFVRNNISTAADLIKLRSSDVPTHIIDSIGTKLDPHQRKHPGFVFANYVDSIPIEVPPIVDTEQLPGLSHARIELLRLAYDRKVLFQLTPPEFEGRLAAIRDVLNKGRVSLQGDVLHGVVVDTVQFTPKGEEHEGPLTLSIIRDSEADAYFGVDDGFLEGSEDLVYSPYNPGRKMTISTLSPEPANSGESETRSRAPAQ